MTPPLFQALEFPTILQFKGPDAVRFLNGQMTQDAAGLGNSVRLSCITNAKGRLEHFISIQTGDQPDTIWVVSSHDSPDELKQRLERYLIADDVEVTDLSGQWQRVHAAAAFESADFMRESAGIFGQGFDLWWQAEKKPSIEALSEDEREELRIKKGIPAWGLELGPGILPPEAGLDLNAISYDKGCYIGQEVLSRIKTAGKVNRRLALLRLDAPAQRGEELKLGDRTVGELTSVSPSGRSAMAWITKAGYEASSYHLGGYQAHRLGWA